jgi:hypothetical protein
MLLRTGSSGEVRGVGAPREGHRLGPLLRRLGILGVRDRPAEPLDELCGVIVLPELHRVDALVKQDGSGVLTGRVGLVP